MNTAININSHKITMLNGLYCLNDLHKASGGNQKHRPKYFLNNLQTKELVEEISKGGIPPLRVIHGGTQKGTYACRKLVYAYCAWVSAKFYNLVLDVFDNFVTKGHYDLDYLHSVYADIKTVKGYASVCGRGLNQLGKTELPKLKAHAKEVEKVVQPSLFDDMEVGNGSV